MARLQTGRSSCITAGNNCARGVSCSNRCTAATIVANAMPLNNPVTDGVSIWVGGKVSNARREPMFSKLAIPYLPNNPPRWPEVVEAVVVEKEPVEGLDTFEIRY